MDEYNALLHFAQIRKNVVSDVPSDIGSKSFTQFKVLVIGEKNGTSLSDRSMIQYGLETMNRKVAQHTAYREFIAGREAYMGWLDYVKLKQQGEAAFNNTYQQKQQEGIAPGYINLPLFDFYLDINSLHTKQCIADYYKALGQRYSSNAEVKVITDVMLSAINEIAQQRKTVDSSIRQSQADWAVSNTA